MQSYIWRDDIIFKTETKRLWRHRLQKGRGYHQIWVLTTQHTACAALWLVIKNRQYLFINLSVWIIPWRAASICFQLRNVIVWLYSDVYTCSLLKTTCWCNQNSCGWLKIILNVSFGDLSEILTDVINRQFEVETQMIITECFTSFFFC